MNVFFGSHNIISPLGYSSSQNFDALLNGATALKAHSFPFSEKPILCSKLNGEALQQRFSETGDPGLFTHLEKLCILSIQDVLKKSGVDHKDKSTLLILSTTKGNIDVLENSYSHLSPQRAYLPEFARIIGDFFSFANTPLVVSNACISGLLAIIIAKRFIKHRLYKNIIVCGADIVSEFTLSGFKSFNAMSDQPCKPFDAGRTGINLGEAAASVLLSEARTGNVVIRCGASANDANHISGPSRNGDGLFQAVSETLKHFGGHSVDLISAHGTATEYNDEMESIAFSRAALEQVPLHSLKGYYGHTLGTAGVLESIIAIESLKENILLASAGFNTPGTSRPLNVITSTIKQELKTCLKTASGFGGCNAAAVFEKI